MSANADLTQAEWNVMEFLWKHSPVSGREVTQQMEKFEGWSRSTTLTLLSRLEAKGAVGADSTLGKKQFYPLLDREDAALHETESFLSRVYKGSVSMMVSAMTEKKALSKEDMDELYAMLRRLEGEQ